MLVQSTNQVKTFGFIEASKKRIKLDSVYIKIILSVV